MPFLAATDRVVFRRWPAAARLLAAITFVMATGTGLADAAELCVTCSAPDAVYRCQFGGSTSADPSAAQLACIKDIAQRAGHGSCAVTRAEPASCNGQPWVISTAGQDGTDSQPGFRVEQGTIAPGGPTPNPQTTARPPSAAQPGASPGAPKANSDSAKLPPLNAAPPAMVGQPAQNSPGLAAKYPPSSRNADAPMPSSPRSAQPGGPEFYAPAGDGNRTSQARQKPAAMQPATPSDSSGDAEKADPAEKPLEAAGDAIGKAGKSIGGAAKKTWDCVSSLFSKC